MHPTKVITDDTERLYTYRALSNYPLVVQAGLSRESITAPWRRDLLKIGVVLVFLIAVLAVFGLIVLSQLRQRMVMERELRHALPVTHRPLQKSALHLPYLATSQRLANRMIKRAK
ncbi:hypothetical protein PS838_02200 [Pseudomonas fluorescens]|nr:hypothetical protein PS838_02200 [Pseudomonas fluorescens]